MFEAIWRTIAWIVVDSIFLIIPLKFLLWGLALGGFGAALYNADAGNWTATFIFAALGVSGVVGLIVKHVKADT